MAGYTHLTVHEQYRAYFKAAEGKGVRKITEAIADDARAGCPIDSGDLVDSIGTSYPGELRGIVTVGTDHWRETEYGSAPHLIHSHGRWSLRSDEGEYFGRTVHHPGTPEQPFMRPALYRKRSL